MDISLSFTNDYENLPALAAACSRNVDLIKLSNSKRVLSIPSCPALKSRNAIIMLLRNFNPLDGSISDNLLWHEKFIKPILYQFYKLENKIRDEYQLNLIQQVLRTLENKFGSVLQAKIMPLELLIWGDLYLILRPNSNYTCFEIPSLLRRWFNEINGLNALNRALNALCGEDEEKGLIEALRNLTSYPVDKSFITYSIQSLRTKDEFLRGAAKLSDWKTFPTPKLPQKNVRNILITSALPYVNNVPHLGNLIGSTLSADVFSRYCRARGWNSIYVCGTDEYGTTSEVKALEEKMTPREVCDKYSAIHADIYRWFNIDFDVFGRTSDTNHTKIVQDIFRDIHARGFILEDEVTQLFCEACEKFLADRLVEGVCPNCAFNDARGDQCDSCGKLINAVELKKPRCKLCSAAPIIKTSKHLFLDLCSIQSEVDEFVRQRLQAPDCVWSTSAKAITNSWLKEGLKPRCITRDLKWGVPVPLEGYESKVFYVWFDAVLGYISITSKYAGDDWRQWWLKNESHGEVELYQFMAKDNVPFHSVVLPANLIGTGKSWNILRQLAATEYLNYENSKFSKSRGLGVFGNDAKTSGIEADVWRFYLISCRPESQDSSFMWDEFATRNNSELLGNLGNFINRALSFVTKFFDGVIPSFMEALNDEDMELVDEVNKLLVNYVECMDQLRMRDALSTVLKISALGNVYIQRNKPWVAVKSDEMKDRASASIAVAANLCVVLGVLLGPIMPIKAEQILVQCNAPAKVRYIMIDCRWRVFLSEGHKIGDVVPLFQKMESDFIKEMKGRFSALL